MRIARPCGEMARRAAAWLRRSPSAEACRSSHELKPLRCRRPKTLCAARSSERRPEHAPCQAVSPEEKNNRARMGICTKWLEWVQASA